MQTKLTVSQICNLICLLSMLIIRAPNSTPGHRKFSFRQFELITSCVHPSSTQSSDTNLGEQIRAELLNTEPTNGQIMDRLKPLVGKLQQQAGLPNAWNRRARHQGPKAFTSPQLGSQHFISTCVANDDVLEKVRVRHGERTRMPRNWALPSQIRLSVSSKLWDAMHTQRTNASGKLSSKLRPFFHNCKLIHKLCSQTCIVWSQLSQLRMQVHRLTCRFDCLYAWRHCTYVKAAEMSSCLAFQTSSPQNCHGNARQRALGLLYARRVDQLNVDHSKSA